MINILIVEDETSKSQEVEKFLTDTFAQDAKVQIVKSVSAAIKFLRVRDVDLLILDLFLPIVDDGMIAPDGGAALLRDILSRNIKAPRYVVGLTAQHPEAIASADVYNEYSSFLILQFQAGSGRWRKQLGDQIKYILSRDNTHAVESEYDYAIITALADPEFRQVINLFPELSPHSHKGDPTTYYKGKVKTKLGEVRLIAAHAAKMGMCASVLLTTKILEKYRPKKVIMTGIAAGIRDNTDLRDLLIPNYIFALESGKRKRVGDKVVFLPSPDPVSIDASVTERINHLILQPTFLTDVLDRWPATRPANQPSIRIGAMGTGMSVIQDGQFARDLIKGSDRKIIGIDMEAYGVIYACSSKAIGLILKSVSDFADEEKNDDQQAICSYLSAAVARKIITDSILD